MCWNAYVTCMSNLFKNLIEEIPHRFHYKLLSEILDISRNFLKFLYGEKQVVLWE